MYKLITSKKEKGRCKGKVVFIFWFLLQVSLVLLKMFVIKDVSPWIVAIPMMAFVLIAVTVIGVIIYDDIKGK